MSESTTVEIGDTEVEVSETEDGFEVAEVEEEPEGLYLRATDTPENYGCEIPLGAEFHTIRGGSYIAWHEEDSIADDLKSSGNDKAARDAETDFDGHAFVNRDNYEIVSY